MKRLVFKFFNSSIVMAGAVLLALYGVLYHIAVGEPTYDVIPGAHPAVVSVEPVQEIAPPTEIQATEEVTVMPPATVITVAELGDMYGRQFEMKVVYQRLDPPLLTVEVGGSVYLLDPRGLVMDEPWGWVWGSDWEFVVVSPTSGRVIFMQTDDPSVMACFEHQTKLYPIKTWVDISEFDGDYVRIEWDDVCGFRTILWDEKGRGTILDYYVFRDAATYYEWKAEGYLYYERGKFYITREVKNTKSGIVRMLPI